MELRDYQRECLESILARYRAGVRRQLVCLPTGTGKTVVFASFPSFFRMKRRMLVLAHREELLDQARDKILRANPSLSVGIEQGRKVERDYSGFYSQREGEDTSLEIVRCIEIRGIAQSTWRVKRSIFPKATT